ncbi:MAG: ribosomal protein S18-alanine N-acetyltransferase [Pseudarthrobacter sp.]
MSTPSSADRPGADRPGAGRPGAETSRTDGVAFRDMALEDVPAVNALEQRLFPADAWPLEMFLAELSQPETRRYLVAECGGDIVGYAGLMCIEPIADVQTIAVVPEFEGRGIGSALLTRLIEEARRRRAADVLLEVREDNPRAQQLYVRFGFEQIHVRRKYYRDGVDALIMRLQLVPDGGIPPHPTEANPTTTEAGQA